MLEKLLAAEVYNYFAVFIRMGTALAFMPGFSTYMYIRQRLGLALAICFLVEPLVRDVLPPMPESALGLAVFIVGEATIGLFLAIFPLFLLAALNLAGNKISMSVGLANARAFDPISGSNAEVLTFFLSLTGIILIFALNLHHLLILAIIDSYQLFVPGKMLPLGDFFEMLRTLLNRSFHVGFQLGAPFIVFAIVFHTGMGLASRLMPQLNIFFISLPVKLYCGFSLLAITVPVILMWFIKYFEESINQFLSNGYL